MYCENTGKIPSFLNKCLQEPRSGFGNNSDYSFLWLKDMDTMCRVAPEDYSMGHQGIKLGIIYWF